MTPTTPATSPRRASVARLLAAMATAVAVLWLGACTNDQPAPDPAADPGAAVVVQYLTADDAGDWDTLCSLTTQDPPTCLDQRANREPRNLHSSPPEVVAAYDWTQRDGSPGRAYVANTYVNDNPVTRVFGVVEAAPDQWKVKIFSTYDGDPANEAAVLDELAAAS